mgnify:CR=1 FL=1
MAAMLIFSGTQLVLLGLIGEYVGRMFLAVNQRPQKYLAGSWGPTSAIALAERHGHSWYE